MNWIIECLKKFNKLLSKLNSTFINFLHFSTILIVTGLSFASGYTTYHGMLNYVIWWIALVITVAVQTIIVIAAFELSKSYFKAHRLRFLGLSLSLLIGLIVSVNFTYIMLQNKSTLKNERNNNLKKMEKEEIEVFFNQVKNIFKETIDSRSTMINELDLKVVKAEEGTLEELPRQYRMPGRGKFTKKYEGKLQKAQQELDQFWKGINDFRKQKKIFYDLWNNSEIIYEESIYTSAKNTLEILVLLTDRLLLDYGNHVIQKKPEILTWIDFTKSSSSALIKPNLSLFLALMIDFLALIFSARLGILPLDELSEKQKNFIKDGINEFSDIHINSHDQLQIGIHMTNEERSWKYEDGKRYNDSKRKRALALLLSKGLMKRVNANYVEFTQELYDIILDSENEQID